MYIIEFPKKAATTTMRGLPTQMVQSEYYTKHPVSVDCAKELENVYLDWDSVQDLCCSCFNVAPCSYCERGGGISWEDLSQMVVNYYEKRDSPKESPSKPETKKESIMDITRKMYR